MINGTKNFINNMYLVLSIFVTPWLDNFFVVFTAISLAFSIEAVFANYLYE